MKALILCAGYAVRLYPLTINTPKPLLKIAGKSMIEHILYRVGEVSHIDDVYIVTNNKFYNNFVKWSKNYKSNKNIEIINDNTNSNEGRLGAIGDMHFVINKKNIKDDLLVIAGDNLFEFSLLHMNKLFEEKKKSVIGLYDIKDEEKVAKKLGVAIIDDSSKIIDFEEKPEKPKSTLAATCCYMLTKKSVGLFEECLRQNKPDNAGDFIRWLSNREHVYGFVFTERWFDIGSHEQLKEADLAWRNKHA